jgi:hypothetical protein
MQCNVVSIFGGRHGLTAMDYLKTGISLTVAVSSRPLCFHIVMANTIHWLTYTS